MNSEVDRNYPLKIEICYKLWGAFNNIFGDHGNMEHNFREQWNSVKMNFGEHQNLFWGIKGEIAIFCREQGNMHPPWEALIFQDVFAYPSRWLPRMASKTLRRSITA